MPRSTTAVLPRAAAALPADRAALAGRPAHKRCALAESVGALERAGLRPATLAPMAKRGRPPVDPSGEPSVEIRVRVTQAQAEKLDRIAPTLGREYVRVLKGGEQPARASVVRLMIDAYPEP